MTAPSVFDFGHFVVRLDQRQLVVRGHGVPLGSRAFDVLEALVLRRDRLVTKAELLDLVWPNLVVEENNLQVAVSALRKLLGPQVIATVPGRGYRFTALPLPPGPAGGASPDAGLQAAPPPAPTQPGQPAPAPAAPVVVGAPAASAARSATAPARVLVAEDNKVNRLLLARTLELLGHAVHSVDNGRKALALLREQTFDLLLLDLEMPEMDGFAVLETLAADEELRELPVIVTSSLEGVAQVARCIELGAEDYLRKPVNAVLLRARVGNCLDKRRLREQHRALIRQLHAASAGLPGVPGVAHAARDAGPMKRIEHACVLAARLAGVAARACGEASEPVQATLEAIDACHTLMAEAVAGQGGVIVAPAGEGLVAVFARRAVAGAGPGRPQSAAPEYEPALAATRAALELAEMIEVFDAERALVGAGSVGLHVGVASGELLLGGSTGAASMLCLGPALSAALDMQALAQGTGQPIVVDGATQAALAGRVATVALDAGRSAHAVRTA